MSSLMTVMLFEVVLWSSFVSPGLTLSAVISGHVGAWLSDSFRLNSWRIRSIVTL